MWLPSSEDCVDLCRDLKLLDDTLPILSSIFQEATLVIGPEFGLKTGVGFLIDVVVTLATDVELPILFELLSLLLVGLTTFVSRSRLRELLEKGKNAESGYTGDLLPLNSLGAKDFDEIRIILVIYTCNAQLKISRVDN